MLRTLRRMHAPELDASYELLDVRTPWMRVGVTRGRNVTSDFALVDKAAPFIRKLAPRGRCGVSFVLRGRGRFDEAGRHGWLDEGSFVASDLQRAGSEAYAGAETSALFVEWEPDVLDAPFPRPFSIDRASRLDVERLRALASSLSGGSASLAVIDLVRQLRALGFPLRVPTLAELDDDRSIDPRALRVQDVSMSLLSDLQRFPAIDELVDAVGSNVRQVHRQFGAVARRYAMPWTNWRAALHHTRMSNALRLLSAPAATTEIVARLTGFRAPSALCHALSKAGLPSPGVLARAARRDALEGWTSYARDGKRADGGREDAA